MSATEIQSSVQDLLPIIRFGIERGDFGIAIYSDEIVLFRVRKHFILPEEAYHSDGVETLHNSRAREGRAVRIPIKDITKTVFSYPRISSKAHGTISTRARSYGFTVDRREAQHVDAVLKQLLGPRFTTKGNPSTAVSKRDSSRRQAKPGRPPAYLKKQATLLRIAAIPTAITIAVLCSLLAANLITDEDARVWSVIGAIALGIFVGYYLLKRAYHLALTPAAILLATDSRPPILYLRSFKDDGTNNLHPLSIVADLFSLKNPRGQGQYAMSVSWMLLPLLKVFCYALRVGRLINLFRGIRTHTAEEQFSAYFKRIGPFVAIGRPGEKRAQGGAARIYVGHDEWQQKVAELLPRCQVILLQPEETEGVWWEIMHTLQQAKPETILFCLVNYSGNQQRYEEFRRKFQETTHVVLPRMIGRYMFLCFGPNWEAKMMESRYHSEFTWPWRGQAVNFDKTLKPFFNHVEPPPFSEKDRRFSGYGWLAVIVYFVLSIVFIFGAFGVLGLLAH